MMKDQEWRPIEEAPMDGTHILVWNGVNRVTAYYDPYVFNGEEIENNGYWCLVEAGDHCTDDRVIPQLWQPLPAPPVDPRLLDALQK